MEEGLAALELSPADLDGVLEALARQNQLLLDRYHEFRTFVERKVANGFHITKDAGLFLAR